MNHKSYNEKKLFRRKIIISSAILLLLLISVLVLLIRHDYKTASEAVIRRAAAMQLNKDPNELTDADFASIKSLYTFNGQELCNIKLLEKFTSLEELNISGITFPEIPKWMKILSQIGLMDIAKRNTLDLGPIENLENLKTITFLNTPIRSFKPLSKIKNIELLVIGDMEIHDFESLKNLKNIKAITLINTLNITPAKYKELKKALPETQIMWIFGD